MSQGKAYLSIDLRFDTRHLLYLRRRFLELTHAADEANRQIDALHWQFFDLVWGPRIGAVAIFGSIALAWLYAYLASR